MRFMPAAIAPDVTSTISRPSSFRPTISRTISSMRARFDAPFSRVMVLVPTLTTTRFAFFNASLTFMLSAFFQKM